jgi:hypothetical protein
VFFEEGKATRIWITIKSRQRILIDLFCHGLNIAKIVSNSKEKDTISIKICFILFLMFDTGGLKRAHVAAIDTIYALRTD